MSRFETKPTRPTANSLRLHAARVAAGLALDQAANLLGVPIIRLAMLEAGAIDFERPAAWREAVAVFDDWGRRRARLSPADADRGPWA